MHHTLNIRQHRSVLNGKMDSSNEMRGFITDTACRISITIYKENYVSFVSFGVALWRSYRHSRSYNAGTYGLEVPMEWINHHNSFFSHWREKGQWRAFCRGRGKNWSCATGAAGMSDVQNCKWILHEHKAFDLLFFVCSLVSYKSILACVYVSLNKTSALPIFCYSSLWLIAHLNFSFSYKLHATWPDRKWLLMLIKPFHGRPAPSLLSTTPCGPFITARPLACTSIFHLTSAVEISSSSHSIGTKDRTPLGLDSN